MANFTGKNGIPIRTNTSLVDIVVHVPRRPPETERGWETEDYNADVRGTGTRTDEKVPTA